MNNPFKEAQSTISAPSITRTSIDDSPVDGGELSGMLLGDRYTLLEVIGQGGMGAVYRARHIATGNIVAIKVLSAFVQQDDQQLARFQQEAVILAGLNHPNIVAAKAIDFDSSIGRIFLVMQYLEGITLGKWIKEHGRLSKELFIDFFTQAAKGLCHAHERSVIHRDIKPGNIMLVDIDGKIVVKIVDFGVSKLVNGESLLSTQTGMVVGSPSYMSPEQFFGAGIGPASDIYSLGCAMYYCLTGNAPFVAEDQLAVVGQHIKQPLPSITGNDSAFFNHVIQKATQKRATDRFASMSELIAVLQNSDNFAVYSGADSRHRPRFLQLSSAAITKFLAYGLIACFVSFSVMTCIQSKHEPLPPAIVIDQLVAKVRSQESPTEEQLGEAKSAYDKLAAPLDAFNPRNRDPAAQPRNSSDNLTEMKKFHICMAILANGRGYSSVRDQEFEKAIQRVNENKCAATLVSLYWARMLMEEHKPELATQVLKRELNSLKQYHSSDYYDSVVLKRVSEVLTTPNEGRASKLLNLASAKAMGVTRMPGKTARETVKEAILCIRANQLPPAVDPFGLSE